MWMQLMPPPSPPFPSFPPPPSLDSPVFPVSYLAHTTGSSSPFRHTSNQPAAPAGTWNHWTQCKSPNHLPSELWTRSTARDAAVDHSEPTCYCSSGSPILCSPAESICNTTAHQSRHSYSCSDGGNKCPPANICRVACDAPHDVHNS